MILLPPNARTFALLSAAGLGLAFGGPLAAQTVDNAPVLAPTGKEAMAHTDAKGRRLAPYGTFYITTYVSAKTDKGVEGFVPGQEVRFVDVDRDKHMLVVTDGRAQVTVSPAQLTNDLDIAAMVRQQDQAAQAKLSAYVQAEQTAYQKYEREQAQASARDMEQADQQRAVQARAEQAAVQDQSGTAASSQPADGSIAAANSGYYGAGGYGYGSPYGYFFNGNTARGAQAARSTGSTTNAAGTAAGTTGTAAPASASATGTATSATAGAPAASTGATTGAATSGTAGATGARTGGSGGGRH